MGFEICKGSYEKLGITQKGNVTYFTVENKEQKECSLLLYPLEGGEETVIPMEPDRIFSRFYSVGLVDFPASCYAYLYRLGEKTITDSYAERIIGRESWGESKGRKEIKCSFNNSDFSWRTDALPEISKDEMVIYKLHVRGFSMDLPKETGERGTFRALMRKLPYFKELGVTTLELMPIYEFEELFALDQSKKEVFPPGKINYWGYTLGNYLAPKSAYLGEADEVDEIKKFIYQLHQNQMECILEFYFEEKLNPNYIIEVLRYWAREYHVDGFHVMASLQVVEWIAQDPYLAGRKLFYERFSQEFCQKEEITMKLFSCNDDFAYGVRRLLNRQGGTLQEFTGQLRRQQKDQGFVNYVAGNNGFTLYDLFSYTQKRNLDNQEENEDGNNWNYSCNCGEEGITRKKAVNDLRFLQMKNALSALLFAQGVPLIWMGDECGNSQKGNNNAYCQDNEIGWKSWPKGKRNRELLEFLKTLLRLRKKYPVLHQSLPMEMNDYKRTGYPDLSYHGQRGWQIDLGRDNIPVGLLYSNQYLESEEKLNADYIYIGYNFTLVAQELALPALPGGGFWNMVFHTGREDCFQESAMETKERRSFWIEAQSVCMLIGTTLEKPGKKMTKTGGGKNDGTHK